jgi:type II secretory pathway pseudopilin PulG
MQLKRQIGFALLEVFLAVIVISLAAFGVIELFSTSKNKTDINSLSTEVNAIASAFSKLSTQGLLNNVKSSDDLIKALNASQLLPASYFNDSGNLITLRNSNITFASVSVNAFTINVPLDSIADFAKQICTSTNVFYNDNGCTPKNGSLQLSYPRSQ